MDLADPYVLLRLDVRVRTAIVDHGQGTGSGEETSHCMTGWVQAWGEGFCPCALRFGTGHASRPASSSIVLKHCCAMRCVCPKLPDSAAVSGGGCAGEMEATQEEDHKKSQALCQFGLANEHGGYMFFAWSERLRGTARKKEILDIPALERLQYFAMGRHAPRMRRECAKCSLPFHRVLA